ncbi:MAG: hypothetical protein U0451_00590 [Candidatus Saccharimonadales bacterium]
MNEHTANSKPNLIRAMERNALPFDWEYMEALDFLHEVNRPFDWEYMEKLDIYRLAIIQEKDTRVSVGRITSGNWIGHYLQELPNYRSNYLDN